MKTFQNFDYNKIIKLLRKQMANHRLMLMCLLGLSFLLMLSLIVISYITGISIGTFTRDPLTVAAIPLYSGSFSQLGNIIWFFAAGITFITYRVSHIKYKKFLLFSTLFSLMLGVDDLFLIHDGLFLALGVSELWIFGFYALFTMYYFISFNKFMLKTPFVFLFLAIGFFSLSIFNDLLKFPGLDMYILEDGFKMAGILSWGMYYYKCSVLINQKTKQKQEMQFYAKNSISEEINSLQKVAGE